MCDLAGFPKGPPKSSTRSCVASSRYAIAMPIDQPKRTASNARHGQHMFGDTPQCARWPFKNTDLEPHGKSTWTFASASHASGSAQASARSLRKVVYTFENYQCAITHIRLPIKHQEVTSSEVCTYVGRVNVFQFQKPFHRAEGCAMLPAGVRDS